MHAQYIFFFFLRCRYVFCKAPKAGKARSSAHGINAKEPFHCQAEKKKKNRTLNQHRPHTIVIAIVIAVIIPLPPGWDCRLSYRLPRPPYSTRPPSPLYTLDTFRFDLFGKSAKALRGVSKYTDIFCMPTCGVILFPTSDAYADLPRTTWSKKWSA